MNPWQFRQTTDTYNMTGAPALGCTEAAEEAAGLPNWKASPTGAAEEEAAGLPNWKAAPAGAVEEDAAGLPNWKASPGGAAEEGALREEEKQRCSSTAASSYCYCSPSANALSGTSL